MGTTPDKSGRGNVTHRTLDRTVAHDIGIHGEITIDMDADGQLTALRAWRGTTDPNIDNQYVVPLRPATGPAALLPPALVFPPFALNGYTAGPVTIQHELGYYPLVSVIDASNDMQVLVELVHDDLENCTLVLPAAGNYTVYLR